MHFFPSIYAQTVLNTYIYLLHLILKIPDLKNKEETKINHKIEKIRTLRTVSR